MLRLFYGVNFYGIKKIKTYLGYSIYSNHTSEFSLEEKTVSNFINYYSDMFTGKINQNIVRYKKIRSYKGIRHTLRLPCRGQRTHTNAKTVRKYKQV